MCLKSYFKKIVLKLATNGQSDKGFLFTSTFVSKELSAPALGLYTCIKALKYIPGPGVRWAFTGPLVLWFSLISTEILFSRRLSCLYQQLMTEIISVMNGQVTKSYWKLIYGQINDTKHTTSFISRPFGNSLALQLVGDLYFLPTEQESVGKNIFFAQRLKKNFFTSILIDWSGNQKQDFFFFRP